LGEKFFSYSKIQISKVNFNTDILNLKPEDRFILVCLQGQPNLPKLDLDEGLLIHRMAYHKVTSMVYQHLLKTDNLHLLSANTQAKLKAHYQLNIGRNLAISHIVKQISGALEENNIETMALKGAMFIETFPDYVLVRELCDLDIMVKSQKLYKALEVLSQRGFEKLVDLNFYKGKRKQWYFHHLANAIPLRSKQSNLSTVLVELHWQLFSIDNHSKWSEKDLWSRAKYCAEQGVYYLDPIDVLLHLCAHQCNSSQIYIYGLVDVKNILDLWNQQINWLEVIQRAKSQKLLLHLVNVLRLANEFFNTPLPEEYFTHLQTYELQANPGYYFLLERLFQKEIAETTLEDLSLSKVFRSLEYSNFWERLWCQTKLLVPRPVRLRLNYHIGRHFHANN
jgi:hypothetical protein